MTCRLLEIATKPTDVLRLGAADRCCVKRQLYRTPAHLLMTTLCEAVALRRGTRPAQQQPRERALGASLCRTWAILRFVEWLRMACLTWEGSSQSLPTSGQYSPLLLKSMSVMWLILTTSTGPTTAAAIKECLRPEPALNIRMARVGCAVSTEEVRCNRGCM